MDESMKAWIASDGSYGGDDDIITFDGNSLTNEQWERVTDISENDRFEYVKSILEEDDANVRILENMNFGEEWGL